MHLFWAIFNQFFNLNFEIEVEFKYKDLDGYIYIFSQDYKDMVLS